MDKKDLIDIDESKLPDVTLTDEQKNTILKSLKANIEIFNKNKEFLDIDTSLENIKNIEEKLGSSKDDIEHLVKHSKVLRELAIQAIHKDCPIPKDEILYKKLFNIGCGMEAKYTTPSYLYSGIYCYIFISKDQFVSYVFDNFYRLQSKTVIPIKDIKSVGISNISKSGFKLSNNNLIIDIEHKSKGNISTFYLVDLTNNQDKSIKEVEEILLSLGVKKFEHKLTLGKIAIKMWYLLWIIFTIIIFAKILLPCIFNME